MPCRCKFQAGGATARWTISILAILLLVAGVLRFHHLGQRSLWLDEALTDYLISKPFPAMIDAVKDWEQTPPLYHTLLWGWVRLFGHCESALRFPSALFGLAAVGMIFVLGKEIFGRRAGLLAALFLALNPYHIHYSQEARAYSLLLLLTIASCWSFMKMVRGGGVRYQIAYVVFSAAAIYAHLYGALVAIALGITYLLLRLTKSETRIGLRRWLMLEASILLLFGPWINVVLFPWRWMVSNKMFWLTRADWRLIPEAFVTYAGDWVLLLFLAALATLGMILAISRNKQSRPGALLAVLLMLLTVPAAVAISIVWTPVFVSRYGMPALVGLILLASAGAGIGRWIAIVCAGLFFALSFRPLPPIAPPTDWRGIVHDVETYAQAGDLIWIQPNSYSIAYDYYSRRIDLPRWLEAKPPPIDRLQRQSLWIVLSTSWISADKWIATVCPHCRVVERRQFPGMELIRITFPENFPPQ